MYHLLDLRAGGAMKRRQFFTLMTSVFSAVITMNAVKQIPPVKNVGKVLPQNKFSPDPDECHCTYCTWGNSGSWAKAR